MTKDDGFFEFYIEVQEALTYLKHQVAIGAPIEPSKVSSLAEFSDLMLQGLTSLQKGSPGRPGGDNELGMLSYQLVRKGEKADAADFRIAMEHHRAPDTVKKQRLAFQRMISGFEILDDGPENPS